MSSFASTPPLRRRSGIRPFWRAPLLRLGLTLLTALAGALVWTLAPAQPATAAEPPPAAADPAQMEALRRASDAVVGVETTAVADARSNSTLGRERRGSGTVIGSDGLVLTIGYLILEAERVELIMDDLRRLPARVVAYDLATGFGLVQALTPLPLEPAPMGDGNALREGQPAMVVSGGEGGAVSLARLVSRRAFTGHWEYQIDQALFTAPARTDHSGAALFNVDGELLGVGSLVVTDALGSAATQLPGNMFVPVDLLKPILAELRRSGSSPASRRAWLGLNCVEHGGHVQVLRVSGDSPAEVAGLQVGDLIERIDGEAVDTLEQLWKRLWSGGQPEREVTLEVRRDGAPQTIRVQSVDRMKTLSRAAGI